MYDAMMYLLTTCFGMDQAYAQSERECPSLRVSRFGESTAPGEELRIHCLPLSWPTLSGARDPNIAAFNNARYAQYALLRVTASFTACWCRVARLMKAIPDMLRD